jgi:hypothetical protein
MTLCKIFGHRTKYIGKERARAIAKGEHRVSLGHEM